MVKLAVKKMNTKTIEDILSRYDNGESPANLANSYGVHSATIRRYLRSNGRTLLRESHITEIELNVKFELRRILSKFNIENTDILISELDKHFLIDLRPEEGDDAFEIIHIDA